MFGVQTVTKEKYNKKTGAFYTPEYIARFFAKYIQRNVNFSKFKTAKILEPASGSGIFLRTLLEVQFEQIVANANLDKNELIEVFGNIKAIDKDANAAIATRLSLSLLYYLFFERLPELNVIEGDTLKKAIESVDFIEEKFDIIISNPPFIKYDEQNEEERLVISKVTGDTGKGKVDSYLAFVKLAIEILNPGGLGLFVLPHNFLLAKNAKKIREHLRDKTDIKVLADLSALNTFDNASVYVILLIFQKKPNENSHHPWVMRCKSNVGRALNSVLQFLPTQEKSFTSYPVDNHIFESDQWNIFSKTEFDLVNKLNMNRRLGDFLEVNQGFITGNDDVFLRKAKNVMGKEVSIYRNYLPDKDMKEFVVPNSNEMLVFYPYSDGELISENMVTAYQETWAHLLKYEQKLKSRSGLKPDKSNWWVPNRMRFPNITKSKIIMPHLSIAPKFSLDIEGKYAVSHAPFITLKDDQDESLLYFFTGIMNSSVFYWYLSLHSHKYGNGYNKIEVATLKPIPVPNPFETTNVSLVSKTIELVKKRIRSKDLDEQLSLEQKINNFSFELYNLTEDEIKFFTDGL